MIIITITERNRYIGLILRHKTEVIEIFLDEHGWTIVNELIAGVSKRILLTII